jgi:hypothetical protein
MAERGTPGAARAERVAEDSSRLLATAQIGRMLTHGLALAVATVGLLPELSAWFGQWPMLQPYAVALSILIVGLAGASCCWCSSTWRRRCRRAARRVALRRFADGLPLCCSARWSTR